MCYQYLQASISPSCKLCMACHMLCHSSTKYVRLHLNNNLNPWPILIHNTLEYDYSTFQTGVMSHYDSTPRCQHTNRWHLNILCSRAQCQHMPSVEHGMIWLVQGVWHPDIAALVLPCDEILKPVCHQESGAVHSGQPSALTVGYTRRLDREEIGFNGHLQLI